MSEPFTITAQKLFNKAWERAKNPVQSTTPIAGVLKDIGSSCTYSKAVHGGCFIGCAVDLPEDVIRGNPPASELIARGYLVVVLDEPMSDMNHSFVTKLQQIHDNVRPSFWKPSLITLAKEFNLTVPVEK